MHIDKGNDNVYLRTTGAAVPEASEFAGFEQESTDPVARLEHDAIASKRGRAALREEISKAEDGVDERLEQSHTKKIRDCDAPGFIEPANQMT